LGDDVGIPHGETWPYAVKNAHVAVPAQHPCVGREWFPIAARSGNLLRMNSDVGGNVGPISRVVREDLVVLSRDVALDLPTIQAAWPDFESTLDSLRGRRMMGLIYNRENVYRLATSKLHRDVDHVYELDETTVPGGDYLRLTLVGEPPAVYGRIAAAFDALFEHADHDPERPLIEFYRREGDIDCLVPVA
ncbi:MAG TPA: GyrI-like domain-containing protein, partial [Chloroflexota bacterium]|nr:GyrI-like domain-containing protein [Chloroflexota bacterium]